MSKSNGHPAYRKKGQSHKARAVGVADFETTTDAEDCRVWAWGYADISDPENVIIGHELSEYIDFISAIPNSVNYFHNLKFDAYFILYYLLTNGYTHASGKGGRIGTFSTLLGGFGQFYSMTVRWMNGNRTEFRDSLKKLPMTVARVAKSFGYEEGKGEIDYHAARPVGYRMTAAERDYVRRDVAIIAKAIAQVHENKMRGLTIAGDSMATYKRMTAGFRDVFPVLTHSMDAEIRRAYRGGFTYADARHRGKRVGHGIVLDVNSLYPHVMRNMPMPYGVPEFHEGGPGNFDDMTIFAVTFTAKIKPDHIPCIQIRGSGSYTEAKYLTEIDEPTEMMVTNLDWKLYLDHYDIDVLEYGGYWTFKSTYGLFDNYIDHWMRVKSHSEHGIREIAKLHLNSLYGKFASNPNIESRYPVLEDGTVRLKESAAEMREPVYTPVGVFITSYARDLTVRAAQAHYGRFLYADTDSLHLLGFEPPTGLEIHPSKLGAWKFEYEFEEGLYVRPKAYLERRIDGSYINKVAGLPLHVSEKLTFDEVKPGAVFHGKLRPMSVPGGLVLVPVPYEMKF